MGKRRGVTVVGLLARIALLGVAGFLLWTVVLRPWVGARSRGDDSLRIRCRNNLNVLAKGLATYLSEFGDSRWYPWPAGRAGCGTVDAPSFGGGEWLASLYWTRVIADPRVFLCPCSTDANEEGALLGSDGCPSRKPLPPQAVSYAAIGDDSEYAHWRFRRAGAGTCMSPAAIVIGFPPNEAVACDDTQEPINHGERDNGGMSVLFFDSHVEFWTHTKVDLERGVGTGELVHLRN